MSPQAFKMRASVEAIKRRAKKSGIVFDDQKVDTSMVKDLRHMYDEMTDIKKQAGKRRLKGLKRTVQ